MEHFGRTATALRAGATAPSDLVAAPVSIDALHATENSAVGSDNCSSPSGPDAGWDAPVRSFVSPRPHIQEPAEPQPKTPTERFGSLILAFRWGVLVMGLVLAFAQGHRFEASVLLASGILVANAAWRTILPTSLEPGLRSDATLLFELGAGVSAVLLTDGWQSPFVFTLTVPIMIAGLARGYRDSGMLAGLGVATIAFVEIVRTSTSTVVHDGPQPALILALTAVAASYARDMLQEVQVEHERVLDETTRLVTANQLLLALHDVAKSLPSSLDLGEVVASARARFREQFSYTSAAILVRDDPTLAWRVELADGLRMPASIANAALPGLLRQAQESDQPILTRDLLEHSTRGCAPLARSALAVGLRARDHLVGFVTIEHIEPDRFTARDASLLAGMADALALTIDNAMWFSRIRTLAAEAERARIARDLHDRLAQSLAYVGFELERMSAAQASTRELESLRDVVRSLVLELRETLFQLRVSVSEDADLEEVIRDFARRYEERTNIHVTLASKVHGSRLPVVVEQELWRIAQEALTNVERHARATEAWITWVISTDRAWLEIRDDGVGFDRRDVRKESFGLTGMRERADAIGAHLTVDGDPGSGTRVLVEVEVAS